MHVVAAERDAITSRLVEGTLDFYDTANRQHGNDGSTFDIRHATDLDSDGWNFRSARQVYVVEHTELNAIKVGTGDGRRIAQHTNRGWSERYRSAPTLVAADIESKVIPGVPFAIGSPCAWIAGPEHYSTIVNCPCSEYLPTYRPGAADCSGPQRLGWLPTRQRGVKWAGPAAGTADEQPCTPGMVSSAALNWEDTLRLGSIATPRIAATPTRLVSGRVAPRCSGHRGRPVPSTPTHR